MIQRKLKEFKEMCRVIKTRREERIDEASVAFYDSLVKKEVEKMLMNLTEEAPKFISVSTDNYHLVDFYQYKKWIGKYRIVGPPDTFIIATCLMYALLKRPRLIIKFKKDGLKRDKTLEWSMNLELAINCVFSLIAEPSTYYKNEVGEWIEERHQKVEIAIPTGLIKATDLNLRIKRAILKDFITNDNLPIMQMSNMFHLIYLYCQKND